MWKAQYTRKGLFNATKMIEGENNNESRVRSKHGALEGDSLKSYFIVLLLKNWNAVFHSTSVRAKYRHVAKQCKTAKLTHGSGASLAESTIHKAFNSYHMWPEILHSVPSVLNLSHDAQALNFTVDSVFNVADSRHEILRVSNCKEHSASVGMLSKCYLQTLKCQGGLDRSTYDFARHKIQSAKRKNKPTQKI